MSNPHTRQDEKERKSEPFFVAVVHKAVDKIREEPFLFVIAIAALLIGMASMPGGADRGVRQLTIAAIALLAFVGIMGYYVVRIIRDGPAGRPAAGPASTAFRPCGDAQIDQVLEQWPALPVEAAPAAMFPLLKSLFQREAFHSHVLRNQGWERLLFAVAKTELVLRSRLSQVLHSPAVGALYEQLDRKLLELRRSIVAVFGDGFDLARHIDRFHHDKDAFLKNCPAPAAADTLPSEHWEQAEACRAEIMALVDKICDHP